MFTPSLIKKINKAGLVGRGCNNFSTAKKWQAVLAARASKEKYVVCNVSESEPGVFKDKYILEHYPEKVIDGIALAIKTLKATKGFIYLNPEYFSLFQDNLNLLIKKSGAPIELYEKPMHDYVGGEETALLNSMEGKRVEPRLKPPYPTTHGLFGEPTLVNNCETFYSVSLINSGNYKKTRFYCVSGVGCSDGQVKELSESLKVKEVLSAFGHNPSEEYFYQVGGGAAGTCYNHTQLNRAFNSLASAIIYPSSQSEKDVVMRWADFFKNESCGQCVPCREGTYRLRNMLEKHYLADEQIDKKLFEMLVFSLQNTSLCPLGKVSANAILSYWKNVLARDVLAEQGEKCDIK